MSVAAVRGREIVASSGESTAGRRRFRPEIQGLRALAVLLVAAYHFWFGRVSGGVDVFLLISAFLMSGSFARKIESGAFAGPTTVVTYWIHVFTRILPLASLTVVGVLLGIFFVLPQERWLTLIDEAKSVMLYRENWWSIMHAVDYYVQDSSVASPLRHFWSLSVQGQIYIIWPLLFLLGWVLVKSLRLPARPTLIVLFGAVFTVSLRYSVQVTEASQQTAYFNTWARLWEFAAGTIAALVVSKLKLPAPIRAVMGWTGIALIVSCGFVLDVEGKFPGYHALWPVLAATMVILAGDTGTRYGPEKLLTLKPLLALGEISYALYLVHWPILVFYLHWVQQEKAGFGAGLVLLALSILLAKMITVYVETPLRGWRWPQQNPLPALGVVMSCMVIGLVPLGAWKKDINYTVEQAMLNRGLNNEGAKTLEYGFVYRGSEEATTIPVRATGDDWADRGPSCVSTNPDWDLDESQRANCFHTVANDSPSRRVVAVGNSHMQMWAPVLRQLAYQQGWDLVMMTVGGCFYGSEDVREDEFYDRCVRAADSMQDLVQTLDPDLVFVTGSLSAEDSPDSLLAGIQDRVGQLTAEGRTVIGIRDTPRMAVMHKDCLDRGGNDDSCVMAPGQDVFADPQQQMEGSYPGFGAVNMSDVVCPDNACPVAIGNVYVYQDYDHITATYVETTYDFFAPRVLEAIGRAEDSVTRQSLAADETRPVAG